mmetsp:Transcript_13156/g.30744  ORF Transcript_13156/g.30744 Transcript_13156/m.30744 type:complete len:513 (+) Transcript_13156:114-1652(+)
MRSNAAGSAESAKTSWQKELVGVVPPDSEAVLHTGPDLALPPDNSASVAASEPLQSRTVTDGAESNPEISQTMVVRRVSHVQSLQEVKWPRQIGLGFKVENIVQVDTLNCSFTAVIKVSCEWELTKSEHELWLKDKWKGSNNRPPWEPIIELPNASKIEHKQELRVPYFHHRHCFDVFTKNGANYTILYTRYRCVFSELYELNNFPFDCQDLTFVIRSVDHRRAVLLPRFKRSDFAVIDASTFHLNEWDIHPPVASFSLPDKVVDDGQPRSEFIFQVKLKRRYHFYVYRIVVLAGSLTAASLLTWTIDLEMPHRLMLCFTIFLTLVAFQTAMANKLPQVRYFTLLDYYLVACQRFMMFVALEHGVLGRWVEEAWVDELCGLFTVLLFVTLQLVWFTVSFFRARVEEQKLALNHRELRHWLANRRQHQQTTSRAGTKGLFKITCPTNAGDQHVYTAGAGAVDRRNSFYESGAETRIKEELMMMERRSHDRTGTTGSKRSMNPCRTLNSQGTLH